MLFTTSGNPCKDHGSLLRKKGRRFLFGDSSPRTIGHLINPEHHIPKLNSSIFGSRTILRVYFENIGPLSSSLRHRHRKARRRFNRISSRISQPFVPLVKFDHRDCICGNMTLGRRWAIPRALGVNSHSQLVLFPC